MGTRARAAGVAAIVVAVWGAGLVMAGAGGASQPRERQYRSGSPVLSAGQYGVATLEQAEGGFAIGAETDPRDARGGPVQVVPLRARVGPDDFREWIADFCAGKDKTVPGVLTLGDSDKNAPTTRSLEDARLAGFELGALDGSSRENASLTLEIQAREAHWGKGETPAAPIGGKQKRAMASNFRLEVEQLPTARIAKIEAISVRRAAAAENPRAQRPSREDGRLVASDLVFSVAAADIEPYLKWVEETLYQQREAPRRTATVTLLDPSLKESLLQLRATGVSVRSVEPESTGAETERGGRFTVRCSVDRWEVVPPKK